MTVYLLGSPIETGNEIFLVSQEVYDNTNSCLAVYATIGLASDHLLEFLDSEEPVAHCPYDRSEKYFADEDIRREIEDLLP